MSFFTGQPNGNKNQAELGYEGTFRPVPGSKFLQNLLYSGR